MNIRILELGGHSFQLHGFRVSDAGIAAGSWQELRPVRLADGLGAELHLEPSYIERGLHAVAELLAASQDNSPLLCIATSAVRLATNRERLLAPLAERHGVFPRILSGSEEARLAYAGALATLDGPVRRLCVADIGGGSTALAVGDHLGVGLAHSVPVGALLPKAEALHAFEQLLVPVLRRVRVYNPDRLVFASGAARAAKQLLISQGLVEADNPIPTELFERLLPSLPSMSEQELGRRGVLAERRATLPSGVRLIVAVAHQLEVEYLDVARGGLREGAAQREWSRCRLRPRAPSEGLCDRVSPLPFVAPGGPLPLMAGAGPS